MSRTRPHWTCWGGAQLGGALGALLALAGLGLAPLSSGCAALAGEDRRDGSEHDAGPTGIDDDDATDDGPTSPLRASENDPDAAGGRGCVDFTDDDHDGLIDCDDTDCLDEAICCVGSSTGRCCVPGLASGPDFSACSGSGESGILACDPSLTLFGLPRPDLSGGAVTPNGSDQYDSGLVLAGEVDPRVSVVRVSARIRASIEGSACASCIDYVAVGLVHDAVLDDTTRVQPDVALVVNNARRELRLMVGDAIQRTVPFSALGAAAADATYELVTSPDGTVDVLVGTTTLASGVPWAPRGPSRVVAFGRDANPGAGDPPRAALISLRVASDVCDAPASLERRTTSVLPETVDRFWTDVDQPTGASVVAWTESGVERGEMAFAFEGRIHHATATTDGRFRAVADPHFENTALVAPDPAEAWRGAALADPELVRTASGWELWFTAIDPDGRSVIGHARAGEDFVFSAPTQAFPAPGTEDADYDAPSYLETTIGGGTHRYLAMRRRAWEDGAPSELVLYDLASGSALRTDAAIDPLVSGETGQVGYVHRAGRSPSAFDANEVAAPALVEYRGVLRMYFAGRRGTRWAIGVLISDDGRYWRLANDGLPVLSGSGTGFDAISVGEPEPVWIGNELRLYYNGNDGYRSTIGMAHHLVPEVAP